MATDRKYRRKQTRAGEKEAKKMFQQALLNAQKMEREMKMLVNAQPLWRRLWDAHRIIWRCWK